MRRYVIALVLITVVITSGCSFGSSVEKQVSIVLSEMNNAEKAYRDAQDKLSSLEKTEQDQFNEIIELTQEQKSELKTQVREIEEMLEKRLTYIEEEQRAMEEAKKSTDSFDEIVEKADNEDKSMIEELKTEVNNRYDLHDEFVNEYVKLTELQKKLYAMLIEDETNLTELTSQVEEVNRQNEIVKSTIDSFNEATASVNNLKDELFKQLEKD